ncbi:carboxymuconolactone decarboxylase family protein [Cohnella zeiphila]|uniref:Carboxymuconolactone decarboxylase family protein n=1 Tax=Cohnella zeiphila TaxID=2761120 RepID=A0A7X0VX97_9BACL|nr:carboxymuconolactone decarboxylase family protein [Cohnella zeiphila]MBB6733360.1 carboxymuconolactone decarboxylase family protein [Cohnella zeiphila]
MQTRMNYRSVNPEAFKAMLALDHFASSRGIEPELYELIKIRASQINGCAFCLDMHTKDMLKMGGSIERAVLVSVWREAPCFNDAEKAALELTECLTRLPEAGVPQEVYDRARKYYDEKEFVDLIMAVNAINSWNRLGVATGMFPDI